MNSKQYSELIGNSIKNQYNINMNIRHGKTATHLIHTDPNIRLMIIPDKNDVGIVLLHEFNTIFSMDIDINDDDARKKSIIDINNCIGNIFNINP